MQRAVKWRPKKEHKPVGFANELVVSGAYGSTHSDFVAARWILGQNRPRLRDGVDAALAALRRAHE
jgi:hypothetical protein